MDRSFQRWMAFASARLRRATTVAKQAIFTEVDEAAHRRVADLAEAEKVVAAAETLGAAVAKLAQVRAYLDLSGIGGSDEARALLGRLWDRMPPRPTALIREAVERELGAPIAERFRRWDDTPLAAASLGQVHAAEDADGRRLAVKVQYPGVAEALASDLESPALLRRLCGEELGEGASEAALAALRTQILGELDYVAEAGWLERFGALFAGSRTLRIPGVDRARSTKRLLTMERLEGVPLVVCAAEPQPLRDEVARALFRFAFGAPLCHGVFNADPHPGNYVVAPREGERPTVVGFVDFGSSAALGERLLAAERKLFLALIQRDGEALRHAAHEEGLVGAAEVFESATWREWEATLARPFLHRGVRPLVPAEVTRLIALTGELLRLRRMALPDAVLLLWRQRLGALAVIAGLSPALDLRLLLAELLDDGHHPIPLYERWR